jgi:hypothetical protein
MICRRRGSATALKASDVVAARATHSSIYTYIGIFQPTASGARRKRSGDRRGSAATHRWRKPAFARVPHHPAGDCFGTPRRLPRMSRWTTSTLLMDRLSPNVICALISVASASALRDRTTDDIDIVRRRWRRPGLTPRRLYAGSQSEECGRRWTCDDRDAVICLGRARRRGRRGSDRLFDS